MDRAQRPLRTAAVAAAALGLTLAGCGESRNVGKTTSTPASGTTTQQAPTGGTGAPRRGAPTPSARSARTRSSRAATRSATSTN